MPTLHSCSMYDNAKILTAPNLIPRRPVRRFDQLPAGKSAIQARYLSDVQPYFQMAEQYTFSDRMFQTNEG